jgi:hypothetical protein
MKPGIYPTVLRKTLVLYLLTAVLLLTAAFAQTVSARANLSGLHTTGRAAPAPVDFGLKAPSAAMANQPTRTPRPTATPVIVPPPADPTSSNLMIILAGLIVLVILLGLWINRRRV